MYKTIFIDLDDTLWDTRANGKESMEEVFRDYGFDRFFPDFESFYDIYYPNNMELWRQYRNGEISKEKLIVDRLRIPLEPYMKCDEKFILSLNEDFLKRTTLRKKLIPYTIDILEYLYPKYQLYIISNGFEEVQHKKMENSNLIKYFDKIILSDKIGVNKPHPLIFQEAIKIAQSSEKESIMIGDSWDADIQGAKNAGIDQIWLDLGYEKQGNFTPTHRIKSLIEIQDIL
ncbi:YjjG family noncanonical pyrimidine nucleotidase [Bacteroidales bacterium OttesenSCG-928-M06]|nr:YjjG family noncanonical pyrimidine nucleotidase [Bacteroidales bacterium OttesenSCG-928-M06]